MIYKPNHSDWVRENQSNELPDPWKSKETTLLFPVSFLSQSIVIRFSSTFT